MNMVRFLTRLLLTKVALRRPPDFIIGGADNPYMYRWWVIPRNRVLNIYLHYFLRSDDDRALHDHPWINCSVLLRGEYTEHTIAAGGINRMQILKAGAIRLRWSGKFAHRIELHNGECWTLFITGPKYREWGFHCPFAGWVHWRKFSVADDEGAIGKGCEQ